MSPLALTNRDRRALRIGAIVALPLLLLFGVVRPYRAALAEAREELASERGLLADELALLSASERYPLAYQAADSALLRTTPRLFTDPDDVLATAQLVSYVANHALASRAMLKSSDVQPATRLPEGLRMLEVDVVVESDLEGIMKFLDAVERGTKLLVIDDVLITRSERPQERGRPPMPVLVLNATVRGFALVDAPTLTSAARAQQSAGAGAP